jgi:hypothetical protein
VVSGMATEQLEGRVHIEVCPLCQHALGLLDDRPVVEGDLADRVRRASQRSRRLASS